MLSTQAPVKRKDEEMAEKTSHRIRIKAPQDRTFKALSTAEGIKSWYTSNLEAKSAKAKKRCSALAAESRFAGVSLSSRLTRKSVGNALRALALQLELP
jgi:hypothetical protein